MPKTLFDTLLMLRDAGYTGPTRTDRSVRIVTEIVPQPGTGRMCLTVTHPSSGPLARVIVESDYTIRDEDYAKFEAEIRELERG